MSIALVQSVSNTISDNVAFPSNVTSGNLLICCIGYYQGTTTPTCTDTIGTSYTRIFQAFFDNTHVALFYGVAHSSAANTATITATGGSFAIRSLHEFSGGIRTFDASVSAQDDSNTTPLSAGNVTVSAVGNLLFSVIAGYHNATTFAVHDSGTDTLAEFQNSSDALASAYRETTASGAQTIRWDGTSIDHVGIITASFAPGALSTINFRKSLSHIGGRVGQRQVIVF